MKYLLKRIKKILLITFFVLQAMFVQAQGDTTYAGNITVTSQAAVDALRTTLAGKTRINGNLTIQGYIDFTSLSNITDLSPLRNITHITGHVLIQQNSRLDSLTDLNNLQTIGGNFSMRNNDTLTTLGNFSVLQSIGGEFIVQNNDTLTTLGNFSVLQSIGHFSVYVRGFSVYNNDQLTSLGNFPALQTIGGGFSVYNNDQLTSLGNFPALQTIGGGFGVRNNRELTDVGDFPVLQSIGIYFQIGNNVGNNDRLTTLGDFPALQTIGGFFQVDNRGRLTDLGNFPVLQSIGAYFYVINNDQLTSLGNFPALTSIGINGIGSGVRVPSLGGRLTGNVSIVVESNANLVLCSWLENFLLDGNHAVTGEIYINNNTTGCETIEEINNPVLFAKNRVFSHKDSTTTSFNIYANVRWQLVISDDAPWITSLSSGSSTHSSRITGENEATITLIHTRAPSETLRSTTLMLTAVNEDGDELTNPSTMTIHFTQLPTFYEGNITLRTQAEVNEFISNTTVILGNLTIGYASGNSQSDITDLTPLRNMTHIIGDLRIQQNRHLVNLNDLDNLQSIGGNFEVGNNAQLTTLGNFSVLDSIGGNFRVNTNSRLTTLGNFPNLQSIGGDFFVGSNLRLATLGNFTNLQSIGGYFWVQSNVELTTLGNFSNLRSIGGNFSVSSITTLGNFSNLRSIGGGFFVSSITTLGNFSNLRSIGGGFSVSSITTLGNFPALQTIGEYFSVRNNDELLSLGDFPALTSIGIGRVYIPSLGEIRDTVSIVVENNNNLVLCTVLENFLPTGTHVVTGDIYIQNNAMGCKTTEEINNPPPVVTAKNRLFVHKDSTTTSFNIYANVRWKIVASDDATWITSLSSGSSTHSSRITGENESTITLIHTRAPNEIPRNTTLTLTAIDENGDELVDISSITIHFTQLTFYEGNITLRTQAEVNEFISNTTVILGNLTIGYASGNSQSDITDLTPLRNMTHITGDLRIQQNRHLVNLNDLDNLQSIGGYFSLSRNVELTTLGNFSNLRSIGGGFFVSSITTLGNFSNLRSIGGGFSVSSITTLGNFTNLQSIGGNFWVNSNVELTTLGDFPELQSIGGNFSVSSNAQLTDLGDFPVLQSIGGGFFVLYNDKLTSLGSFSTLTSIGIGRVYVPSEGQTVDSVSIVVENNNNLLLCTVLEKFLSTGENAVTGGIYIQNNATGCQTTEEINNPSPVLLVNNRIFARRDSTTTSFNIYANIRWKLVASDDATWITSLSSGSNTHSFPYYRGNDATITLIHTRAPDETPRRTTLTLTAIDENGDELVDISSITIHFTQLSTFYEGDITLRSQEEVNEFISNTAGILGNLTIGYTSGRSQNNITDLTPLSNVTDITGSLRIEYNKQLVNLNGLNKLQSIGGYFSLSRNDSLTTLGNFTNLQTIGENFSVSSNAQLTTLGNFTNLQSIGGFSLSRNNSLTTLGNFTNLQSIGGHVDVNNNDRLTTLGDFSGLQTIGRHVDVNNNDRLTTLGNFSTLQTIGENFSVSSNAQLTTLGNFTNLQSIGGYFRVTGNFELTTLGNFSALQTIGENFSVSSNAQLTTLGNFTNLQSIGGYFRVTGNFELTTLGNFSALQTIGGGFSVSRLTTLGNFSNLRSIGGGFSVSSITTLGNFSNLQTIGGYFQLSGTRLTTLGNFTDLQTIGGYFQVNSNRELGSLGSFPNLTSIGIGRVYIPSLGEIRDTVSIVVENNNNLVLCTVLENFLPTGTHVVTGDIYIQNNAMGCKTTEEINNPVLFAKNRLFVHKDSTTTSFNIYANVRWKIVASDDATWITSLSSGSSTHSSRITGENETTITLIHTRAPNEIPRNTTLVLTAIDEDGEELTNPATMTINLTQLTFYEGNITLRSQEEVDEFILNTTVIDGNLTIGYTDYSSSSDITDLSPLSNMTHITGNLIIQQNEQLNNINDLNNLQTIGGYFAVIGNGELGSLGDFPALTSIGIGRVYVPSERQTIDSVSIVVEDNTNLVLCSWLEKFLPTGTHVVTGDIYIQDNAMGCKTTEEINNPPPVLLVNNRIFTHTDSTTTSFNVYANVRWKLVTSDDATWITSLSSGSSTRSSRLTGENEATITLIHTRAPSETPRRTTLTLTAIDENGEELTNPATMTIHLTQLIWYDGNITLRSQEEVNEFISNTTVIDGNLTIGPSSDITDLTPLSNITHITGGLTISENMQLVNLNALNNLQSIGKNFYVIGNDSLTTLGNFSVLQSIGGVFEVVANEKLTTLGNFPSLTSIGVGFEILGYFGYGEISIFVGYNASLFNCYVLREFLPGGTHAVSGDIVFDRNAPGCGSPSDIGTTYLGGNIWVYRQAEVDALAFLLANVDTIDGNLTIGSTGVNITDLTPLSNITHITGDLRIFKNRQLVNLNDLTHLQTIGGNFHVLGNDSLTTLNIPSLQTIGGDFYVDFANDKLTTLGNFTELQTIGGDFYVNHQNNQLTTLGNFPSLQTIGEYFNVRGNDKLTTLGNFPSLQTIGGYFDVSGSNTQLTTLGNFPSLQTIRGYFSVNNNNQLTTLGNFPSLQSIGRFFSIGYPSKSSAINERHSITTLGNFPSLQTIGEYFYVGYNDKLTTLGNFSSLQTIGGYFYVRGNDKLTTLGNFTNLQSIREYFSVIYNDELTTLGNFTNLQSIREYFEVIDNAQLTTLGNFPALTSINSLGRAGVSIRVRGNSSLSDCHILTEFLPGGSHAVSGEIYIYNNANASVCEYRTLTNTIYRGDITVKTQEKANSLPTILSGKTIINGNLTIGYTDGSSTRSDITDLTPLSNITHITGNLIIQQNGSLVNLTDLNNLQTIGGAFDVSNNAQLTTLSNFPELQTIWGYFKVSDNDTLTTLDNFPELQTIGEYFEVSDNDTLTTLDNFPELQTIGEYFEVSSNDELLSLGSFPNLTSIGIGEAFVPSLNDTTKNVSMVVEYNSSLFDCYTLTEFLPIGSHAVSGHIFINNNASVCNNQNTLTNTIYRGDITVTTQREVNALRTTFQTIIDGNLTIGYTDGSSQTLITNLTPLSNIIHITGNVIIQQNRQLVNLTELNSLQTIEGEFDVSNNAKLTTLGNFSVLQSIGERFWVNNNDRLTTLGNFSVLETIEGEFDVSNNAKLTTLGNFPVLQTIEGAFDVSNNNQLTTLGDFSVLQSIEGVFDISNNNQLTTLGNFSVLETIEGAFDVSNNNQLTTLGDFSELQSIGQYFKVSDNDTLTTLGDFSVLQSIEGAFDVSNNNQLTTLGNFSVLETIEGAFDVSNNNQLTTLGNFSVLETIGGYFQITNNDQLDSLSSFSELQSIGQYFKVSDNDTLITLGNFPELQTIGGKFGVYENDRLPTLGDFPALRTIEGDFNVGNNAKITTLGNFSILQSIGGYFSVGYNAQLTTLGNFSALTGIGTINSVYIPSLDETRTYVSIVVEDNSNLSDCYILTEFLPGGSHTRRGYNRRIYINNNASGCNSPSDINTTYRGNITLSTQAAVGTLSTTLSGKTIINGNLTIGYTDSGSSQTHITNLTPLSNIIHITGNLIIAQNGSLVNLIALTSLQSIGGYFNVYSNDTLTTLGDFSELQTIGEFFQVENNANLTTLGNFSNLQTIGEFFQVENNAKLTTLGDFSELQTIEKFFRVESNDTLTTLGNFPVLDSIGGDFNVGNNAKLITLGDFSELQSIGREFDISNNAKLTTLGNFSALTSIGIGRVYVPSLDEIIDTVSIAVEDNSSLSDCYTLTEFLPGGSHAVSGGIYINNNAGVCTNQDALANTIYRGNITVRTQEEVNALRDTLAGKTRIDGNLTIGYTAGSSQSDITDLAPLSNMIRITGNLIIQQNGQLANLNGLTHLQTLGGYFEVGNNAKLTTLGDFSELQTIENFFRVESNDTLTILGDFTALNSIGRYFNVNNNANLTTLGNFSTLQTLGGYFSVNNNNQLTTLGNFTNLQSVGESFNVGNNAKLTTLGNFTNLQSVGESFNVGNNAKLTTLGNFTNLQSVGGYFYVSGNNSLITLGDLPSLTSIGVGRADVPSLSVRRNNVSIVVERNPSLSDCYTLTDFIPGGSQGLMPLAEIYINDNAIGCNSSSDIKITYRGNIIVRTQGAVDALNTTLSGKTIINGNLTVGSSSNITNLTPLSHVTHITGNLKIRQNGQLANLNGLTHLQSIGGFFSVSNNDTLTSLGNFPTLLTSIGVGEAFVPSLNDTTNNVSVVVEDNSSLSDCYVLIDFLLGGTHAVSGQIYINNNASVCNNRNTLTNTIYRGDITITTQAAVDALRTTFKTIIDGNLTIGYTDGSSTRSDITDLTPLSNMSHITGDLSIQQNGQLVNLNDLNNLQTLGGDFYVSGNNSLITLGYFTALDSIGGFFNVNNNNQLTTLDHFPTLTSIGVGETFVPSLNDTTNNVSIVIEDNSSLSDCYTLTEFLPGGATAVNGDIFINNNASVCNNQNTLTNTIYQGNITVTTQAEVNALRDTLSGKTRIRGNLTIGSSSNITNLTPLSHVTHITGNLRIQQNGQLVNLTGLNNLQSIGGIFQVSNNDRLTSLGNFSALQTIGRYLYVINNDQLTTLGNFPELTSTGIAREYVPSLDEREIISIVVENNPRLSDCCVLEYFISQEDNMIKKFSTLYSIQIDREIIFITNNATECNRDTIQNTCQTLIVTTKKLHQIAYDNTDPIPISFTVGGVATGWTSEITYTPTQANFITLSSEENTDQKGDITITVTPMENMGVDRTATITLRITEIDMPSTQTIVIRQEGFPPYEGDVILRTQAQVDTIRTTLGDPRISVIEGNLTIGPSDDIINLDSLYFLSKVTGNIRIENNFNLVNTGNFPFLQKIEGNFSMLENGKLEHVGSFPILGDIGGYFSIKNNDNLRYLYNFPDLTSIDSVEGVSIEIKDNDLLTYCCILTNFMDGTHQVSGSIDISGNATGCDDISEVSCAPFIDLSEKRDTLLPFISSDFDFTVSSNRRWKLSPIADWVTLSVDSGGIDDVLTYTSVTITPLINTVAERRTATIKLTTIGHGGTPDSVLMNVIQEAAPEIRLANSYTDRDTIDIAHDNDDAHPILIEFTVGGSATGWEISIAYMPKNTNFINLDPLLRNDEKGDIITMAIPSPNTKNIKRTAVITLRTRGHEGTPARDTLTIIQEAAPMIMLTSHESGANINIAHNATVSIPIEFTLDGSAIGWESEITGDSFIGLSSESGTNGNITLTLSPNTTTESRMATITLKTTGQKGNAVSVSLTLTQEASPKIDLASHTDGEIIAIAYDNNNDTDPIIIKFTLDGSATGWESDIIYMPENTGFIDLSEQEKEEDTRVIKIIPSINDTTVSRTAMITLKTMGQKGDPASVIFTITQEAAPTIMLTSPPDGNTISIAHDDNIVSIPIKFTVGGSATGWESEISYMPDIPENTNFITLDTTMNDNQTGPITIMASPMKNAGVERTATITLRTTGQKGDPVSVSLKITQEISPTIELTSYNEGSDDSFLELKSDGRDTIDIAHNATDSITINFTVGGSATDWESYVVYMPENDTSIMISQNEGTDGNITITPSINTSAAPRTATITLKTAGHEGTPDSVLLTVTQEAIPTIELISNDSHTIIHDATASIPIEFAIGGSATGWESDITDNPFISLSLNKGTGQTGEKITIMAIPMKNTGVIDRTDTITLSTMGQTGTPARDTFTITQKAAPAIMLTDYAGGENVNIAHDDTNPRTIRFALGGSATGWESEITGDPFISLSSEIGTNGNIILTPSVNTSTEPRTATITLRTTGPGQTPDSVSLMITQEASPKIDLASHTDGEIIAIAYDNNNDTDPIIIKFTLGGSATGWENDIIYMPENTGFIDLSEQEKEEDTRVIKIIPSINDTTVSRTAMITLKTMGQKGDPASVIFTITQEAAPTIMLTSPPEGNTISIAHDDNIVSIPIEFTVGGSATGWESEISYIPENTNFITLDKTMNDNQTGPITIMASPMENMGVERIATITLRTTGQKGDPVSVSLKIAQEISPTIELTSYNEGSDDSFLELKSDGRDTIAIAYDATDSITINFTVGGSATDWESNVIYMPENDTSIMISQNKGTDGNITITPSINTSAAPRTAMIRLKTAGHEGTPDSVLLTVTQESIPTIELISNDKSYYYSRCHCFHTY